RRLAAAAGSHMPVQAIVAGIGFRVQESQGKWPALKAERPDIELNLIGPLQSNKEADAVARFDVIETVDREKIARVRA
ncbi:hypothetical protein ACC764_39610, partial [Rhizobium ruizarguesonis]